MREHWERLVGYRCWQHSSGWEVHHCGHPTANWPYYLVEPKTRRMVIAQNGKAFRTLALAQDAVRAVVAGYYRVENGQVMEPDEKT
jgi:hypothetical protein